MPFEPIISSSFDGLAQQRAGYANQNANVQRQNLNSFERANEERNNYFTTIAAMRRADAQRQADEQAQQQALNFRRYQFDVGAGLDREQQNIDRQRIGANNAFKAAEDNRKIALNDARDSEIAADALAAEGHFNSLDELNQALPNTNPIVKAAIWEKNRQAREQIGQQYNFTSNLAKDENQKSVLGNLTETPPKYEAPPWYNQVENKVLRMLPRINPLTAAYDYFSGGKLADAVPFQLEPTPNTSWFDALQKRKSKLDTTLAPIEKQGLDQNGVILDSTTGRYKPTSTPPWLRSQETAKPIGVLTPIQGGLVVDEIGNQFDKSGNIVVKVTPEQRANQFKSAEDVKAAALNGRLDRKMAEMILKQKFGFE